MIHGFDIDGVITKPEVVAETLGKVFEGFKYEHLIEYDVGKSLLAAGFIADVKDFNIGQFFDDYSLEILENARISEGCVEYIKGLSGKELHFITARPAHSEEFTERLFHRIGVPYKNVYHLGNTKKLEKLVCDTFSNKYENTKY